MYQKHHSADISETVWHYRKLDLGHQAGIGGPYQSELIPDILKLTAAWLRGHFDDAFPSQSFALVLKKLNLTQQKQTTCTKHKPKSKENLNLHQTYN